MAEEMENGARPEQPADTVSKTSFQRRQTQTMSKFFTANDLGESTMKLMTQYDEDGNGTFDKDEVLNIVNDLRSEFQSNERLRESNLLLKRLLIGAVVFFLLMVASIFGLSFAVASLTKETSVDGKGQLYTADGSTAIATNARADLFVVENILETGGCTTMDAMDAIKEAVLDGHNVVVQGNLDDGSFQLEQLSSSGAIYNEETGMACFPMPEKPDKLYCIFPGKVDSRCNTPESRRRLHLDEDPELFNGDSRRGLENCNDNNRGKNPNCPAEVSYCSSNCPEGDVCVAVICE